MTKIVLAMIIALFVLMFIGFITVSTLALVLAGIGLGSALFGRRKNSGDDEVSC